MEGIKNIKASMARMFDIYGGWARMLRSKQCTKLTRCTLCFLMVISFTCHKLKLKVDFLSSWVFLCPMFQMLSFSPLSVCGTTSSQSKGPTKAIASFNAGPAAYRISPHKSGCFCCQTNLDDFPMIFIEPPRLTQGTPFSQLSQPAKLQMWHDETSGI